ncbi:MAG: hypothetical protein ACI93H_001857, partial [Psychromonas sp.]
MFRGTYDILVEAITVNKRRKTLSLILIGKRFCPLTLVTVDRHKHKDSNPHR